MENTDFAEYSRNSHTSTGTEAGSTFQYRGVVGGDGGGECGGDDATQH